MILGKGVLKICSKFTGEHPCRSVISIKLLCNFIEITLWHGSSPVNLLRISRTPFPKNSSGRLLLHRCSLGFQRRICLLQPFYLLKVFYFCKFIKHVKYLNLKLFNLLNIIPLTRIKNVY